jgi:hypothetical protein
MVFLKRVCLSRLLFFLMQPVQNIPITPYLEGKSIYEDRIKCYAAKLRFSKP